MLHQLLKNDRAIVTGASSGIGQCIAHAFAAAGASVIVNFNSDEKSAERVVREIRDNGGRAEAVQADIAEPGDCGKLFEAANRAFGGVDIVVANAGIQRDAAFTDMSLDDWRKVIDVNLTGQFLCAQEAVRRFRGQGLDPDRSPALGKIIFTSSVHQTIPWAGHANYAAAKGG
jgi:glucose 1-dehydrogenase